MSFSAKNQTNPAVIDATGYTPYIKARSRDLRTYWDRRNTLDELERYSSRHERDLFRNQWECEADKKSLYSRVRWEVDKATACLDRDLERRRDRLSELLRAEEQSFLDEISCEAREDPDSRTSRMLERYKELKTRKEEERQKVAEEKKEQQFRRNCEELRSLVSRKIQRETASDGHKLVREKEHEERERSREEAFYAEQWVRDSEAKRDKERREEEQRRATRVHYGRQVAQQMADRRLEERKKGQDVETDAAIMEEHKRLLKLEEQWRKEMKRRKQHELKSGLDECLRTRLRQRAQEVQDDLLQDLFFLKQIMEDEEVAKESEKKRALHQEQTLYLQYLKDQVEKEAAFEKEVDKMYQEELDKMWERKDREWKAEKDRRRQTEKGVMEEVRKQIIAHMEKSQKMQEMNKLYAQRVLEEDAEDREKALQKLRLIRERNIEHQRELLDQIRAKQESLQRAESKRQVELEQLECDRQAEEAKIQKLLEEMHIENEHPYRLRRKEIRSELCDS